jgi:hypothetical protein
MTKLNLPEYLIHASKLEVYAFVMEYFDNHTLTNEVFIEDHLIYLERISHNDTEEDFTHDYCSLLTEEGSELLVKENTEFMLFLTESKESMLFLEKNKGYINERLYLTGVFSKDNSNIIHFQGELTHKQTGFCEPGEPFYETLHDDLRFAA